MLGWEGWGCTDNSEAYSYSFQLLSTLLLCLSNLMFVPPVAIAIRSHYLLEASVYIFTMFFSTVSEGRANKAAYSIIHEKNFFGSETIVNGCVTASPAAKIRNTSVYSVCLCKYARAEVNVSEVGE